MAGVCLHGSLGFCRSGSTVSELASQVDLKRLGKHKERVYSGTSHMNHLSTWTEGCRREAVGV